MFPPEGLQFVRDRSLDLLASRGIHGLEAIIILQAQQRH